MEYAFVFCSLLILILVLKVIKKATSPPKQKLKLPPGPRKLPLIGNIHQLFNSLPHQTLRDLSVKHGPIMHLQLGELHVTIVSSPEIAQEVLRTHGIIFANRPYSLASWILSNDHSDIIFAPYSDHWRQLRKICTLELFTTKRVEAFHSIREDEVSNMIKSIFSEQGKLIHLSTKIYNLNYAIISRAAFGKTCKYHHEFIAASESALDIVGGFNLFDMFPSVSFLQTISGYRQKIVNIRNKADKIVETIIKEHKEKNVLSNEETEDDDLVDVLLNIKKHGESDVPLTDKIIKAVILDIFVAGGGTSSTTIEWVITELLRNPTLMKKAQDEVRTINNGRGNVDGSLLDELKYLKAVIKETLRLHPPSVFLLPRESSEQCKLNGYDIPAKSTLFINAWAMSRDPNNWNDPNKFDPDRFLESMIDYKGNHFQYLPFGGGRRICPGISFAIPSIQLSLAQLLFHFDWKVCDKIAGMTNELDMTEKFGLAVRRKDDLHLIPIPYRLSYLNETR